MESNDGRPQASGRGHTAPAVRSRTVPRKEGKSRANLVARAAKPHAGRLRVAKALPDDLGAALCEVAPLARARL